jgi:hypothetical protein
LLFSATFLVFVVLHHSIGINDIDAYSYIEGARSLRQGLGYVDTAGNSLNHWPPGYSLLLSRFQDPLWASYWINALSLAVATSVLFLLALQSGWPRVAAGGLAGGVGFGFFQSLASSAKPDILTYATFLAAAFLVLDDRPRRRTTGLILMSVLTPFKQIAVVFFPAFLLHDLWGHKFEWPNKRWLEYFVISIVWLACIIFLLGFNLVTFGAMFPPSLDKPTLTGLILEFWRFVHDFFRGFLANWYGSIRPLIFLIVFALVLFTGLIALASLRREDAGRNARRVGVLVLSFSWALEFVRIFYAGPRLMGYGILLALVGCAPPKSSIGRRWVAYGAACLVAATLNAALVDSSGAGHPRYAAMAQAIEPFLDNTKPLYTNSQGLVDIHLGRRSIPIEVLPASSQAACFLEVRLPNYDAVGAKVWPIQEPTENWTLIADVDGARLYCRP